MLYVGRCDALIAVHEPPFSQSPKEQPESYTLQFDTAKKAKQIRAKKARNWLAIGHKILLQLSTLQAVVRHNDIQRFQTSKPAEGHIQAK